MNPSSKSATPEHARLADGELAGHLEGARALLSERAWGPCARTTARTAAVALNSADERAAALSEVNRALVFRPDDQDLLIAAVTFGRDSGDLAGARQYALRWVERYPEDPNTVQLKRELETAH